MADDEPREGAAQPKFLFGVTFTVTSCILIIVAVGMAAVTWQQWSTAKQQTDELQRRNAMLVMNQVESHINLFLLPGESYVQEMSALPVMGDLNDPALLATSLAAASQIVEAGFLSVDGIDTVVARVDGALSFQTIDRRSEPSFEAERELRALATTPSWGTPSYDENFKAPLVTVWHAVRRGGQYLGAWHAAVSIAGLSDVVSEIGDQFEGTAFVMFGKDRVLAHPNLASQHPDAEPGSPSVNVNRVGDIILGDVWSAAASIVDANDDQAKLLVAYGVEGGETYTGYFRRVYDYGSAPWTLGVWFHSDPSGALSRSILMSLLFGGGLILVSLFIAFIAGRLISDPIVRTAKAAEAIGGGSILDAEPLPPSNITELNDLARSFNAMRRGLAVFETYVPRSLVKRLVSMDEAKLESEEREITIMFTDTVNTCQRIENLGREFTGRNLVTILVSNTVVKHLPASMPYVEVGSFLVKGREEPVVAYQIKT